MYYRISKNEIILFFGKKIAQVWAVTLMSDSEYYVIKNDVIQSFDCIYVKKNVKLEEIFGDKRYSNSW